MIMKFLKLKQDSQVSSNVTFNGCAFRYTDGDVIHTQGGNSTIIDCYFNYIDKTVCKFIICNDIS